MPSRCSRIQIDAFGSPPLQRHVSTRFGKVSIVTVGVGSVSAPQRRFKKKEMYTAWRLDCGPGRQRSATYVLYLGRYIGGASACFLALPQAQGQGASRATRPSNDQRPERRAPATARPEATCRTARRRMIRMAGDRQTAPDDIRPQNGKCVRRRVVRTSSSSRVPTVRTALPSTSSRLALDELVSSLVYRRA